MLVDNGEVFYGMICLALEVLSAGSSGQHQAIDNGAAIGHLKRKRAVTPRSETVARDPEEVGLTDRAVDFVLQPARACPKGTL